MEETFLRGAIFQNSTFSNNTVSVSVLFLVGIHALGVYIKSFLLDFYQGHLHSDDNVLHLSFRWIWLYVWCVPVGEMKTDCCCVTAVTTVTTPSV